jgi:CMD domain protein
MTDIINQLAGIADDSPLGQLRASRDVTFRAAAGSYRELISPDDPGGLSYVERDAIAYRIATLEHSPAVADHHRQRLASAGVSGNLIEAIAQFPQGSDRLDAHLVAALAHSDLLTRSPRDASADEIAALKAAGFSTRDIVSLSQLIAFVSFEVRLLSALRILQEEQA